ncbi:MAG: hypothetical protein WB866_14365, partial [Solirubrobacterales bacterium]
MIGIPRVPLLLPALACLCFAATAQPAAADTQAFGFTGFEQTYVVPDRVHAVRVVAAGGRGGVGSDNPMGSGGTFFGGLAGFGARVEADLAVAPGRPCSSRSAVTAATAPGWPTASADTT